MPITLNTIQHYIQVGIGALKTLLPSIDPSIDGSLSNSTIVATATQVVTEQKNIIELQKDFFPQTGRGEFLDFWDVVARVTRTSGSEAVGSLSIAGSLAVSVPLGTTFVIGGVIYSSTSAAAVANNVGAVTLSFSTGTVTAVTAVTHTLVTGLNVTITGAADSNYNGTFAITVLDENTFIYTIAGTPAGADSGSFSSLYANVPVSSVDIGSDKNLPIGTILALQTAITNLEASGTVNDGGLAGGADLEDDESYRERILLSLSADRGVYTNAQIRLAGLTIPTATRVFITNPSIDYTTDGTTVSSRGVDGATRVSSTVTLDMTANGTDNIFTGSLVTVAGAVETDYNGDQVVTLVTATSITYEIAGTPSSPATGTITISLEPTLNIPIPGIVFVFVLDDNNNPPTPSSITLTDVKDAILPQLTAHSTEDSLVVSAPNFETVDIQISGLDPNTSTMQSSISASLAAFFDDSVDFAEDVRLNSTITAIQNTQDIDTGDFIVDFTLATPSADVPVGNGQIAILGTVTFV
ncbi:baseplate J/gp47 family protein [Candidatus Pacearchaeota archaeon]|nr:baseplate J/gp47 family protein [Candidatus Pacearchaeota archaeon]